MDPLDQPGDPPSSTLPSPYDSPVGHDPVSQKRMRAEENKQGRFVIGEMGSHGSLDGTA